VPRGLPEELPDCPFLKGIVLSLFFSVIAGSACDDWT
jgi:hypothetical protein